MVTAWDEGFAAHNSGEDIDDCPYSWGERQADWREGWTDALNDQAFGEKKMASLALVPDVAEPNVNWLALADDEVADLSLYLLDDDQWHDVSERLRVMLHCKPHLIVDNDE